MEYSRMNNQTLTSSQPTNDPHLQQLREIVQWSNSIDWRCTTDKSLTISNDHRLNDRVLDIRDAFGRISHELEASLRMIHDPKTSTDTSRISFRLDGFGRESAVSHGLKVCLVSYAEHFAQEATRNKRKVRGRAFGDTWTVSDLSRILSTFSGANKRTTLGHAFIPSRERGYNPEFMNYAIDRPPTSVNEQIDGYAYINRAVRNSVPRTLEGREIIHRATYRLTSLDHHLVYDVIPVDPVEVIGKGARAVPQFFAVIEKKGTSFLQQRAAIIDRRGLVYFRGRGSSLLEEMSARIQRISESSWCRRSSKPYIVFDREKDVSEPSEPQESKTPLFDIDAVREASRPNTDEEKFDDLIASALANPEIRELAGRLLVKIAEHARR
jgi:hypothetical protein